MGRPSSAALEETKIDTDAPPSTDHTTCTALHPEFASRGSIQDVVDATRQFQGPIPESKPSCCWPSTRLPGSTQPSSTIAFTTAAGSAATSFQQTDTWWHSSSWTTTRSTDTPAQVSVYDPLCPEQQSSRNPSSEWQRWTWSLGGAADCSRCTEQFLCWLWYKYSATSPSSSGNNNPYASSRHDSSAAHERQPCHEPNEPIHDPTSSKTVTKCISRSSKHQRTTTYNDCFSCQCKHRK